MRSDSTCATRPRTPRSRYERRTSTTVGDELEHWLGGDQPKTLGNFIELFGRRSFALIFMLLMALPTLPLPTGGATHVLEAVTMLVALVVGRRCI
jgi:hypothetical protein